MDSEKEKKSFFIEFKSNYGSTEPNPTTPTTIFRLHGQQRVEIIGHCHQQRSEGVDIRARKKLIIASVLCLVFMIAEVIGGVLSNSLAIATDAAHLLTDFASFMISLFAIWLAGRPSTQRMSFGWYRAEVIGAVVSVAMIWIITAILVWLAVQRVIYKDYELDATVMLITSGFAIIVNIIMGFQLHHGHSHSHGSGKQVAATNKAQETENASGSTSRNEANSIVKTPEENINVRAAFIHVLGDVVQSIGVFVAALVIYFKPEWSLADPICTFVFSVIVLFTTFKIMKDALLVLMEGTPSYLQYAEVMGVFLQIDGVERVHNLRIWALSINKIALSAHLAIRPNADPKKILQDATTAVHLKYSFFETTLQIEDFIPEMEDCQQCVVPKQ